MATSADSARIASGPAAAGAAPGSGGSAGSAGSGGTSGAGSSGSGGSSGKGSSGSTGGGSTGGGTAGGSGGGGSAGSGTTGGAAPGTAGGAASSRIETGGYAVNVNTAPVAVLKSLFDDHDVPPRFFDRVIEYRNTEEEKAKDSPPESEDTEPPLDEFGDPIIDRKIFDTLSKLSEVEGFQDLPAEAQTRLNQLLTTESHVFSIFVVARRSTSVEGDQFDLPATREEQRAREQAGDSLLRIVRCVVWRHKVDEDFVNTPLVRWEVIDYVPFEVQDYPDENR
jgi:hypothetical protein